MSSPEIAYRECSLADAPLLALLGAATFLESYAGFLPAEAILAHCQKNHIPSAWQSLLEEPHSQAWIAEVPPTFTSGAHAPIGYALLAAPEFPADLIQPGDLELRRIYIFSRFHGQRPPATPTVPSAPAVAAPAVPAQRLLDLVLAEARRRHAPRVLLGVHPDNLRALAFYRRNGFLQAGTRSFQVGPATFTDPVLALTL